MKGKVPAKPTISMPMKGKMPMPGMSPKGMPMKEAPMKGGKRGK